MNDKELVFRACGFAISKLQDDGSSGVALNINDTYKVMSWEDVISKLAAYLEVDASE